MRDLERELRDMMQRTADGVHEAPRADRALVRRARLRRARTAAVAGTTAVVLILGGFAGANSLSNDEDLPPIKPDASPFVGTWFSTDIDSSNQKMVVRASGEDAYEIVVNDDSAGVCAGVPSTMTGTGRLDGEGDLVIPSPTFTCDDGSEPTFEDGPPVEEQLRNLTFVHDPEANTLTDSFEVVWGKSEAPACTRPAEPEGLPSPQCMRGKELPETEVARGVYQGTPWRLSAYTEPVIGVNHSEGYHSLGLSGFLGDDRFAFVSGVRPDSELEGTVGDKLWAIKEGLSNALVVSGTVTPDIARVVFVEGGQTRSTETVAVPSEVGDDFRVYVLFAPFGTDVGCLRWEIETVNCFGAEQRVIAFDAAGEVVAEELLHPEVGRDCLICSVEPDADEFEADGTEGGLSWRLSARRYGSERCFAFSLGAQDAGGRACLTRPGSGWFGEVGQRVEPQRADVAPVYGAVPSHVDEVEVALADGSAIPARIFRPKAHSLAYYLAWIPDAYASGSVRFIAGESELGSLPLCAAEYRSKTRGFVCYGTPERD